MGASKCEKSIIIEMGRDQITQIPDQVSTRESQTTSVAHTHHLTGAHTRRQILFLFIRTGGRFLDLLHHLFQLEAATALPTLRCVAVKSSMLEYIRPQMSGG
jgi:hypothetical protein